MQTALREDTSQMKDQRAGAVREVMIPGEKRDHHAPQIDKYAKKCALTSGNGMLPGVPWDFALLQAHALKGSCVSLRIEALLRVVVFLVCAVAAQQYG